MNIYTVCEYFLIFVLYSFIGWSMEVILGFIQHKRFVDRGFLLGPYCPIYGFGSMFIVFLLRKYTDNALVLFILAMVICLALEYLTSYLMELIFKARWWDYSNKKFNINGRVCLEYAILFGLGGTIIMYIVHPFVLSIVNKFSNIWLLAISIALFTLFLMDNIISYIAISKINKFDFKKYKDSTEDISKMVYAYLMEHGFLTKRIAKAFPNIRLKLREYHKQFNK